MKDYYARLGVSHTASGEEIKRAFRKLAVRYHPDKNPDPRAENVFKELSEAYDVLSDWEKRKMYDLRFENPFTEVASPPTRPAHRDPKYRPKPKGYRPPRSFSLKDTMAEFLPYFRWVSWAGIVLTFLLVLDFALPYHNREEDLLNVETVHGSRNSFRYFLFMTNTGKQIKVYSYEARHLIKDDKIRWDETRLFRTIMNVSDDGPTFVVKLGYIYKSLIFFPLILLVTSVLGVSYKKNIEFPFNLSIVSGMFFVITLTLLVFL